MAFYMKRGDYYQRRRGDAMTVFQPGGALDWMPGAGMISSAYSAARSASKATGGALGTTTIQAAKQLLQGSPMSARGLAGSGRYRRMNPLNPRALRRALRRAKGFERFARKVMHFTSRKPGSTRFKFPKRKRR